MVAWVDTDYYDQSGAWDQATVTTMVAQNTALQNGFVARSLNLTATVYIDGVNGNDARTGTTNDNNAVTGRVKTLNRVAQLHNGKTYILTIGMTGDLNIAADVDLDSSIIFWNIGAGATVTFKKKTNVSDGATIVGDGNYTLRLMGSELNMNLAGTLRVEGHNGSTGAGGQYYYKLAQGAIRPWMSSYMIDYNRFLFVNIVGTGTVDIGNNALFFTGSASGLNWDNFNNKACYRRSYILGGTLTLGTNAQEAYQYGDKTSVRSYHPSSASDPNVYGNEIVNSITTNKTYTNRGGQVQLVDRLRRYHPTSSTDANVWEGEMVVSPTNNDLYFKSNGTIRRVTTAAYS